MEERIKTALIHRLGLDEDTPVQDKSVFVLRYESQDAEDRQQLVWPELIRELANQAELHGFDDVLEAAYIERQRS